MLWTEDCWRIQQRMLELVRDDQPQTYPPIPNPSALAPLRQGDAACRICGSKVRASSSSNRHCQGLPKHRCQLSMVQLESAHSVRWIHQELCLEEFSQPDHADQPFETN